MNVPSRSRPRRESVFATAQFGRNTHPAIVTRIANNTVYAWALIFGTKEFQFSLYQAPPHITVGSWVLITHNSKSKKRFTLSFVIQPLLKTQWNKEGFLEISTEASKIDSVSAESVDFGIVAFDSRKFALENGVLSKVKVRKLSPFHAVRKSGYTAWMISEVESETPEYGAVSQCLNEFNFIEKSRGTITKDSSRSGTDRDENDYMAQFSNVLYEPLPHLIRSQGSKISFKEDFIQCADCCGIVRRMDNILVEIWTPDHGYGVIWYIIRADFESAFNDAPRLGLWIKFDALGPPDRLSLVRGHFLSSPVNQMLTGFQLKVETVILDCGVKSDDDNPVAVVYSQHFGFVLDHFKKLPSTSDVCYIKCWLSPLYNYRGIYWTIAQDTEISKVGSFEHVRCMTLRHFLRDKFYELQTEENVPKKPIFTSSQATETETVRYCIMQIVRNKDVRGELEKEDRNLLIELQSYVKKWRMEIPEDNNRAFPR